MRNSTLDFTFTILHDHDKTYNLTGNNIKMIPVELMGFLNVNNLWWYKLQAFKENVAVYEQNLLLDLDIVILTNIDKFWNYNNDKFVIIQDFNRHWFPNYQRSNSSIVKFTPEIAKEIYNSFVMNPLEYVRKFRGDQDYFDHFVKDKVFWPKKWAMSWKWEVYNGGMIASNSNTYYDTKTLVDEHTAMLVFHGKPDPHEISEDIVKLNWL